MPTIAILADIHGNVPALDAVMDDIASVAPDEVLVGGDLVGRGPQGRAVVERIRTTGWRTIGGNHEDYLLDFRRGHVPDEWLQAPEWAASRWMAAELGDEAAEWIAALPFTLTANTTPALRLVHGTPESNRQGIGPWTRPERLEHHLAAVDEPLLVCAHTHRPLVRRLDGGLVVNVGSVGLPFDGDRRARYALVHVPDDETVETTGATETTGPAVHEWPIEMRAVDYDVERTLAVYRDTGFLAEGGVTARLLALEVEHATPFLVPFLEWSEVTGAAPEEGSLPAFRREYDERESLRDFFERLTLLRAESP